MVDRDDVLRARATIGDRLPRTPMLSSRALGARLKCELFQRTGSFKARGALNKLSALTADERRRGVIAISAGNHAQAVAYAAAEEGVDALVVMWRGRLAAEDRRDARLRRRRRPRGRPTRPAPSSGSTSCSRETGRTLVHPFDDPVVLAGAGTVGLEIVEDAPDADAVIVAVGGGGLVTGIAAAIGDRMRVVVVEPEDEPALHAGLAAGRARSRRAAVDRRRAQRALRGRRSRSRRAGRSSVSSSRSGRSRRRFRFLYERAKLACEPAGAAAAAALLAGKVEAERPVVVVSGRERGRRDTAAGILARR